MHFRPPGSAAYCSAAGILVPRRVHINVQIEDDHMPSTSSRIQLPAATRLKHRSIADCECCARSSSATRTSNYHLLDSDTTNIFQHDYARPCLRDHNAMRARSPLPAWDGLLGRHLSALAAAYEIRAAGWFDGRRRNTVVRSSAPLLMRSKPNSGWAADRRQVSMTQVQVAGIDIGLEGRSEMAGPFARSCSRAGRRWL